MANQEHLQILKRGVDAWNKWREEEPNTEPDLSSADLSSADLSNVNLKYVNMNRAILRDAILRGATLTWADLSSASLIGADLQGSVMTGIDLGNADLLGANLTDADLTDAYLVGARLSVKSIRDTDVREFIREANSQALSEVLRDCATLHRANLSRAELTKACLTEVDLSGANLSGADLTGTNLNKANMNDANLTGANLSGASLLETSLKGALLEDCIVYGVSAWDMQLEGAKQSNLIVIDTHEGVISVDDLRIAQFIYQLLNNKYIRDAIHFAAFNMVLILGHFTSQRRNVLDAIKSELSKYHYWPIFFDYEEPATQELAETIATIASLSRFVIVDLTELKSVPLALHPILPHLKNVPLQPLLEEEKKDSFLFHAAKFYPSILPAYSYKDSIGLQSSLKRDVIEPSEKMMHELERRRA